MNATGETGARWKIHRPLKVGMEKRVTWEKWDRAAWKKSKSEMRTMGTGKRDFTVLEHLPKNERDEDRGRIWKIFIFHSSERVIFDITSSRLSIVSDRLVFRAKSGCINVPGAIHPFLDTSKVDNVCMLSRTCEQTHRYCHHRVRSRRWIMWITCRNL